MGAALAVLLIVSSVAACGISQDDSPRAIDRDAIPELRTPTTAAALPAGEAEVKLIFPKVAGDSLREVTRSAKSALGPKAILQQLMNGPTETERAEFEVTTSIPAGTKLLDVVQEDNILIIDLNEGIDSIQGPGLINAYAQIVWTAARITGVQLVRFQVNGEDRPGASDAGPQDVLDTGDFGGANRVEPQAPPK